LAALALASVTVAGCGGSAHTRTVHVAVLASTPTSAAHRAPPYARQLAPSRPPPPPSPALQALRGALENGLQLGGPASGAEVFDITRDSNLFAMRSAVKRPPASVEKLWTSIALLGELGPHARLHTTVLGTGHLGPGGVWHGNLYLRGGGDPTFGDGTFNHIWNLGYGPTAGELAQELKGRGIQQVTGSVFGDQSLFVPSPGGPGTRFAPDVPDFGGELSALTYDHGTTNGSSTPAAFAVRQFVATLRAEGVQANAGTATVVTPPHARPLAQVSSPPLSVLLKLMDVPSDDLFAELLTDQLGVRFGAGGSISDGAAVIHREIVEDYDLHPRIIDGSGLSRQDHSSPAQVVDLLRDVWHTMPGRVLWNSLPVVGVSGTTTTIATGTAAQGNCVAKTGTLDNVTNLAGYCHRPGQHVLAFALFIDGPSNQQALALEGRMVAAIAKY
jgi:serine-type D-Ala-D-Ala carboxypeptidase/endopeptidase (penicillin-binding protein 4)